MQQFLPQMSAELVIGAGLVAFSTVQLLVLLYALFSVKGAARERAALTKEIYGLTKKIEGLTANKRDQMAAEYDRIVQTLAARLPTVIAGKASDAIVETEEKILTRLAELEPNLRGSQESREKLSSLVASMESLERKVVGLTAETVQQVMHESRQRLFDEAPFAPEQ